MLCANNNTRTHTLVLLGVRRGETLRVQWVVSGDGVLAYAYYELWGSCSCGGGKQRGFCQVL